MFYSSIIHNIDNTDAFLKGITSLLAFLPLHEIFVCFYMINRTISLRNSIVQIYCMDMSLQNNSSKNFPLTLK